VCVLSSQSCWAQSATTVAGKSAGTAGTDLFSLYAPFGLYYDQPNNRIIVADRGNARAIQFSVANPSSGGSILAGGSSAGCNLNQLNNPAGVVVDSYGQLYVSDTTCRRVLKFPPNSNSSSFGVLVVNTTDVEELTINPLTGDLYAAGYVNGAIYLFAQNSTTGRIVAGT
jgi:hypothetical protein